MGGWLEESGWVKVGGRVKGISERRRKIEE